MSVIFPLSYSQQALYFSSRSDVLSTCYNIPLLLETQRNLEKKQLYFIFNELGKLYPLLYLKLHRADKVSNILEITDIPIMEVLVKEESEILQITQQLLNKPFKLFDELLFKVYLIRINNKNPKNFLYIIHHHLLTDIFPASFFQDFIHIYMGNKKNNYFHQLSTCSYIEFVKWEEHYLQTVLSQQDKDFWLKKIKTLPQSGLSLFNAKFNFDSSRSQQREFYTIIINHETHDKLINKAKSLSISLFAIYLSALFFLLYKLTKKQELVLATVVSRRFNKLFQQSLGDFTNRIILHASIPNEINDDFLIEIFNQHIKALQHGSYPYLELMHDLSREQNDVLLDKIVSIIFHTEQYKQNADFFQYFSINHSVCQLPNEPLNVEIIKNETNTLIHFKYKTDFFSKNEIIDFANDYIDILSSIADLTSIHEVFERQAKIEPNLIAVVSNHRELTYQELNQRANQLARYIEMTYQQRYNKNLQVDTIIAIVLPRGIEAIIAMLAVLKANACYLPLEVTYPKERIQQALSKARASLVITSSLFMPELLLDNTIYLDKVDVTIQSVCTHQSHSLNSAKNLAYVIFTSGTTGEPNAVAIEHGGVVNLAVCQGKIFEITRNKRVLQFASYAFDASISEIWCTLLNHGTLCVPDSNELLIGDNLSNAVKQYNIDIATIPPSILSTVDPHKMQIDTLVLAGEPADDQLVNTWFLKCRKLINAYGPSEATVCATIHVFTEQTGACQIGLPLNKVKVYLLDDHQRIVPIGVNGEIYIGGIGLARGYLHDAELTSRKFIIHPDMGLIYRTGDVGRYLYDNSIEYRGRNDSQVKIRGYRIELLEIEKTLLKFPDIKQALVMVEEQDELRIVAFIRPNDHFSSIELVKQFLKKSLPKHMLPHEYVMVANIPLTYQGKIDRQQLFFLKNKANAVTITKKPTSLHEDFIAICAQVLQISAEEMDIHQDFFHLGGTSLSLLKLIARLNKQFDANLTIQDVFTATSLNYIKDIILNKIKNNFNYTSLMESDLKLISHDDSVRKNFTLTSESKNILLTGASGFLGVNILLALLKLSGAHVFCLIRSDCHDLAKAKLMASLEKYQHDTKIDVHRIHIILGDLSLPDLGLTEEKTVFIKNEIDSIIHAAAEVNHLYPYDVLRKSNVLSTAQLIRLAQAGRVSRFHYISTIDTVNVNIKDFDSENGVAPHCMLDWGYIQSKWVSENLLDRSCVPFTIYRPGNITGHSVSGAANPTRNHAALLLKTCIESGVSPHLDHQIEMTPVDYLSEIIVKIILSAESQAKVFYNLHHPFGLTWSAYLKIVEEAGYDCKIIPISSWEQEYLAVLPDDHVFSVFKPLYLENKINQLPLLPEEIKHAKTTNRINDLNCTQKLDYSYLIPLYLEYYRQSGFILRK